MKQLSENILDIAENSTRAKASEITITLTENTADSSLLIVIRDNGCGMTPEMVASVTDPFVTTRTTRRVGLGIPMFKMEAEMTGGHFYIKSEVGVGTETGALFYTNHMDFIPLGDIGSTMMTLIGGNPETHFIYRHTVDGEVKLELDTDELRAVLGDVPLDTPEVLLFIRDHMSDEEG